MSAARRRFQAAPEQLASTDRHLVVRAAESRGAPADLAWNMLVEDMGTVGPDLLYSITLTKPRLAERAEQLLANPALASKISPALAIARTESIVRASCSITSDGLLKVEECRYHGPEHSVRERAKAVVRTSAKLACRRVPSKPNILPASRTFPRYLKAARN